jgi:PBP1b-binding outer membrane lipoprotein LpoB
MFASTARASLILLASTVWLAGCSKEPAPAGATGATPASTATNPAAPTAGPAFTTTATALVDEYEADAKAWQAKYVGKSIELTGMLDGFGNPPDGKTAFIVAPEPLDIYKVWC